MDTGPADVGGQPDAEPARVPVDLQVLERRPAPLLGEHSAEILDECGFTTKEVSRLAISGDVGVRV